MPCSRTDTRPGKNSRKMFGGLMPEAGARPWVCAAVLLVLLCNAVGVAAGWQFFQVGAAALLRPSDDPHLLGRICQTFESYNVSLDADSSELLPLGGRAGFLKPGRFRLRPAVSAIPATPYVCHPTLPRPPPKPWWLSG
jgi:hypothetical protein